MQSDEVSIKDQLVQFFGKNPLMFLKFSNNPEHLQQLQKGNLYMNTLRYYVNLEEQNGVPGMGDKLEALNVLNDVELSFYTPGTDELVGKATAKTANFRYEDAMYKPVFCLYALTFDMLEVVEATETSVRLRTAFSPDDLRRMENEFGSHVLICSGHVFLEFLDKSFKEKGHEYTADYAKYQDFSQNNLERIRTYAERNTELFFYKDTKFEHQKEYRIVILNQDEESHFEENIGSLEGYSTLTETSELGAKGKFEIQINFK